MRTTIKYRGHVYKLAAGSKKQKIKPPAQGDEHQIRQVLCPKCGGMKKLVVDGKPVDPMKWTDYGFAADLGCIC